MKKANSVVLVEPGLLSVSDIEVPELPMPSVEVEMRACGICGSDIRYLAGENPWSQHTLGRNVSSPPNMVLGHEVAGVTIPDGRRVAILAFRGCGRCKQCASGNENLCEDMYHFGHSAGWSEMDFYPGGMSERFNIWIEGAVEIPERISFEAATFLDGLAVALHALDTGGFEPGMTVGVIGMGPVGMLAAMAAQAFDAENIVGCDTDATAVRLAHESGLEFVRRGDVGQLKNLPPIAGPGGADVVIDTVGSGESIDGALRILDKQGSLVLLAVHGEKIHLNPMLLNSERRVVTSANNRYADFSRAIDLLAEGKVRVDHLITHKFALREAEAAFDVMKNKEDNRAFKVVLTP